MLQDRKAKRQDQIVQAAYELLDEFGYEGISMLKIAKRAKASNETLYKWYGDKKGLFHALVRSNAAEVEALLQAGMDGEVGPQDTLEILGPRLLGLLVGSKAVALNRAAAGDASGDLGRELAKSGRASVMPLIEGVFIRLCRDMNKPTAKAAYFADIYLRLLVGDLQVRRVTGGLNEPTEAAINVRAQQAQKMIGQLLALG